MLALLGQFANGAHQPLPITLGIDIVIGVLVFAVVGVDVVERHGRVAAVVAMVIGDDVVSDAIQPCGEGQAAIVVVVHVFECACEGLGREVFCICRRSDAVVDVAIDGRNVSLVQHPECVTFVACALGKGLVVLGFEGVWVDPFEGRSGGIGVQTDGIILYVGGLPAKGASAKRGEFRQPICLTRRREEREGKSLRWLFRVFA